MAVTWEENTERRLGIVEQKVDKLLDPETGIYPKLEDVGNRLRTWAIAILTALLLTLVGLALNLLILILRSPT